MYGIHNTEFTREEEPVWIIDKIPGASRAVNATIVVAVVAIAVTLAMTLGALLTKLPTVEVVTGSPTVNMTDIGAYKVHTAYTEAARQDAEDDLVESITDLIIDLGSSSLYDRLVGPENTPEQNLANFRWAFCSEVSHRPLEIAEMMIDAEAEFDRFRDAGMFPEMTGDFEAEVASHQCFN